MSEMRRHVAELEERRAAARAMGGERRIARQHERGKMTVRERLDALVDSDTFEEFGLHASEYEDPLLPADGIVTGVGKIDGRMCCIVAFDFTVKGGSMGVIGVTKLARIREISLRDRIPMVYLVDSGGARLDPRPENVHKIPLFANSGYMFREQVVMSGVVPQVAAMVGPGAAGTAYIPGLADFVPMVKKTSSMALAGPALVKAAVGQEVSEEELGGSQVHNKESGVADMEVEDDAACIQAIKDYLSYFPSNCTEKPPIREGAEGRRLLSDDILDLLPDDTRRPYDIHDLIRAIADDGEFFEIKPLFARAMVTCFTRINGYPVGVVANNPAYFGGVIESDTSFKAERFVNLCDAFDIPLVFLVDVPGFIVGKHAERSGIIRHGAGMLHAVARATVPKMTVIVRKAYGAGYYAMCGRAFEPDLIVAWPKAEISVMGPQGMINIALGKMLDAMDKETADSTREAMAEQIRPYIEPYQVARLGLLDDVIDPRETRNVLISCLERTRHKVVERPWKRHGVAP